MTWYPIAFLPPQLENTSGTPYSGAVLKAYEAGTNTNIPIATDFTGTTTANSIALNSAGYPTHGGAVIIPHLQQNYKLALYPSQAAANADSGAIWTVDNIQIAADTNSSFIQYFDGDGVNATFTLSEDFGLDENILMVFADRAFGNHVDNGTFATDTIWTKGSGWTIGGGVATAAGAISTAISQNSNVPIVTSQSYTVEFTVTASAGTLTPSVGGTAGTTRGAGTWKETIIAGSTQEIAFTGVGFTGTLDNVSIHRVENAQRLINRPDEYTVNGNQLTLNNVPPPGTKNVIVFAPSQLLGAANNAAAAAATSESNAAASAAAALDYLNDTEAAAAEVEATVQLLAFRWNFDDSTTMADPGAGDFRLNNATLASVTAIALSDISADAGGPNVEPYILTWDDASNTVRGTIVIRNFNDVNDYVVYDITDASVDNSGWTQLSVTYRSGGGTLVNGDTCLFQFARSGDAGTAFIADDAITNAKLANMAQATIKGRETGAGTGDPVDLTATQATAILNAFVGDSGSGGTKGLVPAPASGDAAANKFLKASGAWETVVGGVVTVKSQSFISSGTYTPNTGMLFCLVECLGGGGGGGGSNGNDSAGGGGGAAAYARSLLTAADIGASQVVTIGAGGSAGSTAGGNGGTGGTSSLGSLVSANGGSGGTGSTLAAVNAVLGGAGGSSFTGQDGGGAGAPGSLGFSLATNTGFSGNGGSSFLGGGALGRTTTGAGANGTSKGAGGAGGRGTSAAGGTGAGGRIWIMEFCSQ